MNELEDFDEKDFDIDDFEFDYKNMKDGGVPWLTRFLLRFWPEKGMERFARQLGLDSRLMKKANDLFSDVRKVDIVPLQGGERGFQIILDRNTALYFYQNGDHFVYDGSETGKYEKGDVTIFDNMPF